MSTKPADFFIGVIDFFAIILPGALLAYLALVALRQNHPPLVDLPRENTAPGWVAFALSSYLLGHFASLIGAFFLDGLYDKTYRTFKSHTWRWGPIEQTPDDKSSCYQRTHLGIWSRLEDQLYRQASALKDAALGKSNVTTYKWARMTLQLHAAGALQEIDRLEADSKFFRSVTVVLLIVAAAFGGAITSQVGTAWGGLLLVIFVYLSFWRFSNLRWKAAEAAYLAVIAWKNRSDAK
jgi:hypothetical protein